MNPLHPRLPRRELLKLGGAVSLALTGTPSGLFAGNQRMHERVIPKSGETISVIGMGTSRTFNAAADEATLERLTQVLRVFFAKGGQLIDSSPMYGAAESVLGKTLPRVKNKQELFVATKVWTDGRQAGVQQMQRSAQRMGRSVDLMQIHNLRDWQTHLPTLRAWKEQGKIRYIGVTTSHGRYHEQLKKLLKTEPFDFVQFSYSIGNREAEQELLPLARDKGMATLVNRPFERGNLFQAVQGKPLPSWAAELQCTTWGQFFLKFVMSHPDVTCLIPATSKPKHMADNMGAGYGPIPDEKMRKKMLAYFESL